MSYLSIFGACKLLGLPVLLLVTILKYYTVGLKFRKFKNNLWQALKLVVFRTALSLRIPDTKILALMSNEFLIRSMIGFQYRSITKNLPGFGERYDENSFWLVRQPDRHPLDPILIYLHGGGYFLQTQPAQIESTLSIYKLVDPEVQEKLSILFLDYTLACYDNCHLPLQTHELHTTYKHLTVRDKNSNILFLGDSAGGNYAITYSQYLKQLNAQLGPDRQEQSKLIYPRTLILVSPWLRLTPNPEQFQPGRSFYDNDSRDMIRYSYLVDKVSTKYLIGDDISSVNSLTISPNSKSPQTIKDWEDIPTFGDEKSNILIIAGEDESFRDDILEFAEYAFGVPHYSKYLYGFSGGKFNAPMHQYIREPSPGKCGLRVYVEPLGVHDSFFFFENHLLSLIQAAEKKRLQVNVDKLNDKEFFATKRIVNFLDDILLE